MTEKYKSRPETGQTSKEREEEGQNKNWEKKITASRRMRPTEE